MQTTCFCFAAVLLIGVTIQDFIYRAVSWIIFPAVTIALFALQWMSEIAPEKESFLSMIALNVSFVTINIFLLQLYFSIKTRSFESIINTKLGLGDVCMFYTLAVCFCPLYMICFFIVSMLLSITIAGLTATLSGNTYIIKNVPLAGMMALFLLTFMVLNLFLHINTLDDTQIVKFLTKHEPTAFH